MSKPSVYLAGPITGYSWFDITSWRKLVSDWFRQSGIETFSPLRGKEYLSNETEIKDSYTGQLMSTQRGILARDHFDATHRDLLFANLLDVDKVSIGTVMEIAWAHESRVPIILCMTELNIDGTKNPHYHAMIREACPLIAGSLEEGVKVAKYLLLADQDHR